MSFVSIYEYEVEIREKWDRPFAVRTIDDVVERIVSGLRSLADMTIDLPVPGINLPSLGFTLCRHTLSLHDGASVADDVHQLWTAPDSFI